MCCLLTLFVFLGPRAAILGWWLIDSPRVTAAIGNNFIVPILGWIFLPFTTLIFIILAPVGGLQAFDWIWLGFGFLLDVGAYSGGTYGNRDRFQTSYR